nr:ogr/Delta-like zinc finger family protein [Pandoraea fibrosis]
MVKARRNSPKRCIGRPFQKCPHCEKSMQIRTSRPSSRTMREIYYLCTNIPACGFVGKYLLEGVSTITPSQNPNPDVFLPISKAKQIPVDDRQMNLLDSVT